MTVPVVHCPPHSHSLIKMKVEDPNHAADDKRVIHVGILQADLVGPDLLVEGGGTAGLCEHWD